MLKYIVQPGDSLYSIAQKYRMPTNSIARANMIYNPYNVYPGQLLYIPLHRYDHMNNPILDKSAAEKKAELFAPPFSAKMILPGLLLILSISQQVYHAGGTIVLNLIKLNLSSDPISLHYSSGQRYDFKIIYPTGHTLWMWSIDKSFIQALGTVTLDVGQSILYSESFTLPINTQPGLYQVLGWNTAQETHNIKLHLPFYITNHI